MLFFLCPYLNFCKQQFLSLTYCVPPKVLTPSLCHIDSEFEKTVDCVISNKQQRFPNDIKGIAKNNCRVSISLNIKIFARFVIFALQFMTGAWRREIQFFLPEMAPGCKTTPGDNHTKRLVFSLMPGACTGASDRSFQPTVLARGQFFLPRFYFSALLLSLRNDIKCRQAQI